MTIPVRSATLQPVADVPLRRLWATAGSSRRLVLETARATLEWSVSEVQVQRSMGATRPSARDGRPPSG
jgi:hypothetical protein